MKREIIESTYLIDQKPNYLEGKKHNEKKEIMIENQQK